MKRNESRDRMVPSNGGITRSARRMASRGYRRKRTLWCAERKGARTGTRRALMVAAFNGFEEDELDQGRTALPHFHPPDRSPEGVHACFEAPPRHARKRKR